MKIFYAFVLLFAIFKLIDAYEEYRRVCLNNEVDVGIRKTPWENFATHTCISGPLTRTCVIVDARNGFTCTGERHLQGGLPYQKSLCCDRKFHRLVLCRISQLFSFRDGFNIQLGTKVIKSVIPNPIPSDQTAFRVEICNLLQTRYGAY
ncbi:uncharacterized protein LOC133193387 [Saccostrea echinata]|uniref:uncharacterized protein LOC133180445 n=1 Tax=Saccostrea echinata TaxID=191078 RepID=UPI002A7F3CA6|nr:uncharacterized protein LOC133180445 [Saccostrea echinata]XP_061185306.1 uncharacterized protein LOC133193387 [Saccostrea echinata]